MKGKHAQKKAGAGGAMAPTALSLKTQGRGGGGLGGLQTRIGPGCPPGSGTQKFVYQIWPMSFFCKFHCFCP